MTDSKINKSKKNLVLLLLAFITPVIIAKLYLNYDLYQGGVTNKGELINENISYQQLDIINLFPQKWQIIYLLPASCDQSCQQRLYILQQSHIALGKEQERVIPLVMTTKISDLKALTDSGLHHQPISENGAKELNDKLVIVDPLGKWVMSYNAVNDKQALLLQGKDILADLRKMLKLSRIG